MDSTKPMKQPQLSALHEQSENTCEMTSQQIYDSLLADDAATGQLKSSQLHELLNATPFDVATDATTEIDLPVYLVESTRPQMETVKLDLPLIIEEDLRNRATQPTPKTPTVHPTCQIDVNQIIEAMPIAPEEEHNEQDAFLAMMGMSQPEVPTAKPQIRTPRATPKPIPTPAHLRKKNTLHVLPPNPALPPIIAPTPSSKQVAARPTKLYMMIGAAAFMFVSLLTLMLKLIVFT